MAMMYIMGKPLLMVLLKQLLFYIPILELYFMLGYNKYAIMFYKYLLFTHNVHHNTYIRFYVIYVFSM